MTITLLPIKDNKTVIMGLTGKLEKSDFADFVPKLDELIARGREELDPTTRHSIYRRIEEIIEHEALLLPLFHEQVYRFVRPESEGMELA